MMSEIQYRGSKGDISRRGMLFVLSSPSGAGKTTLTRHLLTSDSNMVLSVSATTRAPRPGEIEGKDYYFTSPSEFDRMRGENALLESARVFENFYGTPRAPVEAWLEQGRDVLFDVDWQGAQQVKQAMGQDMVSIFILPPSLEILEARLQGRGQDSDAVVAKRMAKAADEISHWAEYDYILINDDLTVCKDRLESILIAERARRFRQVGLTDFVSSLI